VTPGGARPRIGFDARALAFPAGGVKRYAHELFGALARLEPGVEFVAVDPPAGVEPPAGTVRGAGAPRHRTNLGRMALGLPSAILRSNLDLFHAPAYTAPLLGSCPIVLTIHDVSYARRPEFYPHALGPLRKWFYRRSALHATRVITDSAFSRAEISAAYGIPAERISVIPLGVSPAFVPPADGMGAAALPAGIRPPYVLHVGELHPRRDLETALRAVIEIRTRPNGPADRLQLVCVGTDRGLADSLRRTSQAAGAGDALVLIGAVSEPDLVRLYQQAVALLYPSRYEGFGLPVVEAMASGLPVVAARAGSVPEVLAGAGVLVQCGDWHAMAEAVADLLVRPEHRLDLRRNGLERATAFDWTETARLTVDVYRSLLPAHAWPGEVRVR
jgi:O-antigen biosynthesis alpha-1,3-rhamnosyltransferase